MDAGRVGAVRREIDLDHRIVEIGPLRIDLADGRVLGQFDDAVAFGRQLQLLEGAQHAERLDAANDALAERDLLAGDIRARRREDALQPRARIGRAADDLHEVARARIDLADAQPVGVRMLRRFDDPSNPEVFQLRGGVVHIFDLEADAGERLDNLGETGGCDEMLFEPGEGEFHGRFLKMR